MNTPSNLLSRMNWKQIGLYCVLFLGIYLRLQDYFGGHWPYYVHDRDRHVEYIRYVNATGCLPPPDAGIEYPQQPLYYFLAATIYQPGQNWRINDAILAGVGLIIAIFGLAIVMMSLKYISSWLVKYTLLIYVALTPSFILSAPFIGNDGMVQVTGFYLFFCLLRLNRKPLCGQRFLLLSLALILALFSKLNAVSLLLICPYILWRTYQAAGPGSCLRLLAQRTAVLAGALMFWAAVTWYHGELGRAGSGFKMVTEDKVGLAPMLIPDTGLNYLCSFHLLDLLQACQASTTKSTTNAVRFSFPTFLYGTMLFGEHEYSHPPQLARATTPLILTGCVLLLGGCSLFFVNLLRGVRFPLNLRSLITKQSQNALPLLTLAIMAAGTLAVYDYAHGFPYTCDADFRFEYPVLAWLGYGIGHGLSALARNRFMKYLMFALLLAYAASCVWLIDNTYTFAFTDL